MLLFALDIGEFWRWKTFSRVKFILIILSYKWALYFISISSIWFVYCFVWRCVVSIKHFYVPGKNNILYIFVPFWQLAEFWTHGRCSINIFFSVDCWIMKRASPCKKRSCIKPDLKSIKLAHALEGKKLNRWLCGGRNRLSNMLFCTRCLKRQASGRENLHCYNVSENYYNALKKHTSLCTLLNDHNVGAI